jgi:hypothetical protein
MYDAEICSHTPLSAWRNIRQTQRSCLSVIGYTTEIRNGDAQLLPTAEPIYAEEFERNAVHVYVIYIYTSLHNEELHNLYSSLSIIRIIKSRRMRWADM